MHLHIHKHTHAEVDSALVKYQCQHHTARMRDIPLRGIPSKISIFLAKGDQEQCGYMTEE